MSEKCKYCDYVSKCSRFCEYNSIMCLMHRSFPKIVDKTYEELEKENRKYKEVIDKVIECISELDDNTDDTTCYDIDKDTRDYILSILKEVE